MSCPGLMFVSTSKSLSSGPDELDGVPTFPSLFLRGFFFTVVFFFTLPEFDGIEADDFPLPDEGAGNIRASACRRRSSADAI
jgi:hypothetical protein